VKRLTSVLVCSLAGMLVAAAPSSAAVFNDVKGKAKGCYFATHGQYVNVGLTTDVDYNPIFEEPQPWPEYVFFDTTIKLRELYGTKWKRLSPKVVRTREYDLNGPAAPDNGSYFYGSRLYAPKAYAKLRKLRGTAQVRLKDAETGELLAETNAVRFSWRKSGPCQLGPGTPQLPITNGGA
jgi:hypothetical protein